MGESNDERELRALAARVAGRLLTGARPLATPANPGEIHVDAGRARPFGKAHPTDRRPASSASEPTPLEIEDGWLRSRRAGPASVAGGLGPFRVAVACDHGGLDGKALVLSWLDRNGHTGLDLGTHGPEPVDYPVFAERAAREVQAGRSDLAVVLDGAGVGSAMAASRLQGVRAANGSNVQLARNAREHNHANVLTLGTRLLSPDEIELVLAAFFETPFGAARHARRVAQIEALRSSQ